MGSNDTIEQHVACIECGYDLHGLDVDARCPECGTFAHRSLSDDRPSLFKAEIAVAKWIVWCQIVSTMSPWGALVGGATTLDHVHPINAIVTVVFLLAWALSTAGGALLLARLGDAKTFWPGRTRDRYVLQSLLSAGAIAAMTMVYLLPTTIGGAVMATSFLILFLCVTSRGKELRAIARLCERTRIASYLAPMYCDMAFAVTHSRAWLYLAMFAAGIAVVDHGLAISVLILAAVPALIAGLIGILSSIAVLWDLLRLARHLSRLHAIEPR